MDFAFSADQTLLKNSARAFLDEHCKPAAVRAAVGRRARRRRGVWKEMAQLGWLGLPLPEHTAARAGHGRAALLYEEMGRAAYPGPLLADLVLVACRCSLGGTDAQKKSWLLRDRPATRAATLALLDGEPRLGSGRHRRHRARAKTPAGWTLSGVKRFVPWAHVADVLLVPARTPEGVTLFLVDPAASGVRSARARHGPRHRWSELTLGRRRRRRRRAGGPGRRGAGRCWTRLLRRAAVGAAAEMLGAARRCLDMAVGYAKVREQFGQPIGSFQAIRHKCAEMLLEVENSALRRVLRGVGAGRDGAEDAALAASIAKSYVGDAVPQASAARPSRCTAASASPGSTTSTSTSSAPRRWRRSTATRTTTAS